MAGGKVEIMLDGRPVFLIPTVEACLAISRLDGGLNSAVRRCHALDFDTICDVVAAGIGANPIQRKDAIPKAVFQTGLFNIAASCIEFINVVANGGRPMDDDDKEDAKGSDPLPESPMENSTSA